MTKPKKLKDVWLTRDRYGKYYLLWSFKPQFDNGKYWVGNGSHFEDCSFCIQDFEFFTGIRMKGGPKSIRKVESITFKFGKEKGRCRGMCF